MLHVGICPHADRWGDVLANLTHVVIDEAHVYRGVFGSHVANVIRRLRRVCAAVGSSPQFLLASATVANPAEAMTELIGDLVEVVGADGAARPARTVALWNPTLLDPDTGERASALAEAAALIAELVARDLRVICFGRSRRMVEVVHRTARETIAARTPHLRDAIAPYRAGYTAEQRRELERRPRGRRAAGGRRHQRARARHRHRPARLRDLDRLPRHGREPAAAVGPRRSQRRRASRCWSPRPTRSTSTSSATPRC